MSATPVRTAPILLAKRALRSDPGRPEVCNVCQLHRAFGDDYEEIWTGERTASTGCVDTKKLLAARVIGHYAEARERWKLKHQLQCATYKNMISQF